MIRHCGYLKQEESDGYGCYWLKIRNSKAVEISIDFLLEALSDLQTNQKNDTTSTGHCTVLFHSTLPLIGTLLVFEHDWHIAARVQVAAGDVDDGAPRYWPSTRLQTQQSRDL